MSLDATDRCVDQTRRPRVLPLPKPHYRPVIARRRPPTHEQQNHHFAATVYTFWIILAVFLVGLGLGSSVGAALSRRAYAGQRTSRQLRSHSTLESKK